MRIALALAVACLVLVAACDRGEDVEGDQAASPSVTASPAVTASAAPTSSVPPADGIRDPAPARTPAPTPTRSPDARSISGLFTDPRPSGPAQTLAFPGPAPSPFRLHDGLTVTLYDVPARTETAYGMGGSVSFSPDGKHLAWAAGDASVSSGLRELTVLDLATRQTRTLGPARVVRWIDSGTLLVFLPDRSNEMQRVDLGTGARSAARAEDREPTPVPTEHAGYRLESLGWTSEYPHWRSAYRVTDVTGRLAPLGSRPVPRSWPTTGRCSSSPHRCR